MTRQWVKKSHVNWLSYMQNYYRFVADLLSKEEEKGV